MGEFIERNAPTPLPVEMSPRTHKRTTAVCRREGWPQCSSHCRI
jgi:hypothetical protein